MRKLVLESTSPFQGLPELVAFDEGLFAGEAKVVQRKVPVRFAGFYMPNGVNPFHWTPKTVGPLAELPSILAPLEKVKSEVCTIGGTTAS